MLIMFKNEQFKMKEGAFVKNYFAHCVDVEEVYASMVLPVCKKYGLTYMEFTVLLFLANNPQYDTATQIIKYRHIAKSHVSISIRSLQERAFSCVIRSLLLPSAAEGTEFQNPQHAAWTQSHAGNRHL